MFFFVDLLNFWSSFCQLNLFFCRSFCLQFFFVDLCDCRPKHPFTTGVSNSKWLGGPQETQGKVSRAALKRYFLKFLIFLVVCVAAMEPLAGHVFETPVLQGYHVMRRRQIWREMSHLSYSLAFVFFSIFVLFLSLSISMSLGIIFACEWLWVHNWKELSERTMQSVKSK